MRTRFFFLFLFACGVPAVLPAQGPNYNAFFSRNSFFLEGLGAGGLYSLNYERRRIIAPNRAIGLQVGVSPGEGGLRLPLRFITLMGSGSHRLEAGVGVAIVMGSGVSQGPVNYHYLDPESFYGLVHMGYRFQPRLGGLLIRAGYSPLIRGPLERYPFYPRSNGTLQHWIYLGIGIALKHAGVG
ncbi:MAG: hypothetical protein D6722_23520 [Bacteroidetes bacterium]|nr:MAG: hypothetical protein D6722_23520 [Bacteroidota bacterium]